MVSMRLTSLTMATALLSASSTLAAVNTTAPTLVSGVSLPGPTPAKFGCYGSAQGMTWTGSYNYMTSAICQIYCLNNNLPVLGTSAGTDCYCGEYAPPAAALLSDSKCVANCTGYGLESCGGSNSSSGGVILSIYNDQLESAIENSPNALTSSSSSTSRTATAAPTSQTSSTVPAVVTVTTAAGATIVSPVASSSPSTGKSSNTAGIAAGVVVGFIVIAAVAGGVWFFMRKKQRREVEEEHKRQVAVNSFIAGSKPEGGNGSVPDVRLDPAILRDRRMSDGSIMDNQDYSRRILKVTNA